MASLRDLGLSEYEARAYRSLLQTGPTTAKELSRASDVPMGRIYDVLNNIEQYNLVRSQTASRPKSTSQSSPRPRSTVCSRTRNANSRRRPTSTSRSSTISSELDAAEPVEDQFWTAAVGPEETTDLLLERLAAADDRIVMVAADPVPERDIQAVSEDVTAELEDALDRGVSIDVLMTRHLVSSLSEKVGERYRGPPKPGRIRRSDDRRRNRLVQPHRRYRGLHSGPEPASSGDAFGMIDLKDPEFAANVREEFVPRWENAEPLTF